MVMVRERVNGNAQNKESFYSKYVRRLWKTSFESVLIGCHQWQANASLSTLSTFTPLQTNLYTFTPNKHHNLYNLTSQKQPTFTRIT